MSYTLRSAIIIIFGATILWSCAKERSPVPENAKQSFLQYIASEKNTTIFKVAFERSGLTQDSAYLAGGPYTFFVPVDDAFVAQGLTIEKMNTLSKDSLRKILRYMVVNGRISGTTMAGFFKQDVTTLAPQRPIVTKNYYGIFFNGIAMQQANINLQDAVVHKMKRVALPPADSAADIIATRPELSIFNAVLKKGLLSEKEPGKTPLLHSLITNGKTIFAPTNDAMIAYGFPSVDYVNNLTNKTLLADLARFQINTGYYNPDPGATQPDNRVYSCTISDFLGGYRLMRLGNIYYTFPPTVREDGYTIVTPFNIAPVKIIRTDILAIDGVIHEVDQVLLAQ